MNYRFLILILFSIFLQLSTLSAQQETIVVGQVLSKADRSPLALVNVCFTNTSICTQTNEEGFFMLRTYADVSSINISSVGYKQMVLKIKKFQSIGTEILMDEEITWLSEILVFPGINPAIDFMKKVRLMRHANDLTKEPQYTYFTTTQNLMLFNNSNQSKNSKNIFNQLNSGKLSLKDSTLVIPFYRSEQKYLVSSKSRKEIYDNTFQTDETVKQLVGQLMSQFDLDFNFYENSVPFLGKSFISPLANIGSYYYHFFITDSIKIQERKNYEITFKSSNPKNLAFDGRMWIDSASYALTKLEAVLPNQANLNFIKNLIINQTFEQVQDEAWVRKSEQMTLNLNNQFYVDSLNRKPEIFIQRNIDFSTRDSTQLVLPDFFAKSEYRETIIDERMSSLNRDPLFKVAKWMADAILTGYAQIGKIDMGELQNVARLTDHEGVRVNIPLRTNERLWKNISIEGYGGYGFKNEEFKFSAGAKYQLPTQKRRIISINYKNDYVRIDYNYNNFLLLDEPWSSLDENAISTIFAFHAAEKLSLRKEWTASIVNDWNKDIESRLYYRNNIIYDNQYLPLKSEMGDFSFLKQQSLTFVTRFSFDQKKYNDHLRRIYIANNKPVVYFAFEGGKFNLDNNKDQLYGKLLGTLTQKVRLDIGHWNYILKTSMVLGRVPYLLLDIPSGNEPGGINLFYFNKMNYLEFGFDKDIQFSNEFVFDGLLFNHIPIIRHLNLREVVVFKTILGTVSNKHQDSIIYPTFFNKLENPYIEIGGGITNLFRIISIQYNYRLTNRRMDIKPWGVNVGLRVEF